LLRSPFAAWMRLSIVAPSSVKKEKLMVDLDGDPAKRKMQEEKKNSTNCEPSQINLV